MLKIQFRGVFQERRYTLHKGVLPETQGAKRTALLRRGGGEPAWLLPRTFECGFGTQPRLGHKRAW